MKTQLGFLTLGLLLSCNAFPVAAPEPLLVKIPRAIERDLPARGVDFAPDHFTHRKFSVGYVAPAQLPRVPEAEALDSLAWAIGGYDRETFARIPVDRARFAEGYHDYDALTDELTRLRDENPTLVRLETAGKSVQGRELWYLVISESVSEDRHKPRFIYHANMHGDEVVGRELMIYLARHLIAQLGKDERITQIVRHAEIFIMPSMNPDGFELRRRGNARGVDVNRNFPDRFKSPSDTPDGREIEVQRMMELAAQYHFVYGINWHGGEICFNLPWGNIKNDKEENRYGDDWFFNPIGREYTEANRSMHANHHANFDHGLTYGYEWYPVNGGINDWLNFFRRSVHSVIELTVTKWPNASTLPKHWDDNRDAMIAYLWRGLRGIHLEIRDAAGALVDSPTIYLAASQRRPLTFDDGYVHRLSGDGDQEITVDADGFEPKTLTVPATYFDGTFTPVILDRKPGR